MVMVMVLILLHSLYPPPLHRILLPLSFGIVDRRFCSSELFTLFQQLFSQLFSILEHIQSM